MVNNAIHAPQATEESQYILQCLFYTILHTTFKLQYTTTPENNIVIRASSSYILPSYRSNTRIKTLFRNPYRDSFFASIHRLSKAIQDFDSRGYIDKPCQISSYMVRALFDTSAEKVRDLF